MEASSRTKSPRRLRSLVVASNLLVAVIAILAIFAGVAIILDSAHFEKPSKAQILKVRELLHTESLGSKQTTGINKTDYRGRYKLELLSKAPSSRIEKGDILEESAAALSGKPTTRSWRNFPYVLVAVAGLTLLATMVGLLAIHREPIFLLFTLTLLVSVLVILQAFALHELMSLEDSPQTNLFAPLSFMSFHRYIIPVLLMNSALSLIVFILLSVQFFMYHNNNQSPFKILQSI